MSSAHSQNRLSTHGALSAAHYEAIGKLASEWSYIENALTVFVWRLAEIPRPDIGPAITAQMKSETMLEILRTIAHVIFGEGPEYVEFTAFYNDVVALRSVRNDVVHGLWFHNPGSSDIAQMHKVKARGKLKFEFPKMTAEDIEAAAFKAADLRERMHGLAVWRWSLQHKFAAPFPQQNPRGGQISAKC